MATSAQRVVASAQKVTASGYTETASVQRVVFMRADYVFYALGCDFYAL